MFSASHPGRVAATLAAVLVGLAVLMVPSVAVADDRGGVGEGQARNRVVVPDWMPHAPAANWRRLMNEIESNADDPPANWRRLVDEVTDPLSAATSDDDEPRPAAEDGSLDYAQFALGGLAGVIIAAAAGRLTGQRRRSPLEVALGSGDHDELSRVAGMLGDRFAQQDSVVAAAHAYRAAVEVGDQYWSPIAQVALAQLLSDHGKLDEAQALFEAAIASEHPRAAPMAQAMLGELLTGETLNDADRLLQAETLSDSRSAHYQIVRH